MYKKAIEWFKTISLSVLLASVIWNIGGVTIVLGESMMPTLHDKDLLIVDRVSYNFSNPSRGDIVLFKTELKDTNNKNKILIKRVIGVCGDQVQIVGGKVYVNDIELQEDYTLEDYTDGDISTIVPEGSVFVLGDNRGNSLDSRYSTLGLVDIDTIDSRAVLRVFPLNDVLLNK